MAAENFSLGACGRTPRRGVRGVGLGGAVGKRVGVATAKSLAAATRLSTAGDRDRSYLCIG